MGDDRKPTEREVEAAAEAAYVRNRGGSVSWGNISEQYKSDWRAKVTPVLLAASRARPEEKEDGEEWKGLTAADVIGVITGKRPRRRPLPAKGSPALAWLTWFFDDERHADMIIKALREEGFQIGRTPSPDAAMREALEKIASMEPIIAGDAFAMRGIARAALHEGEAPESHQ